VRFCDFITTGRTRYFSFEPDRARLLLGGGERGGGRSYEWELEGIIPNKDMDYLPNSDWHYHLLPALWLRWEYSHGSIVTELEACFSSLRIIMFHYNSYLEERIGEKEMFCFFPLPLSPRRRSSQSLDSNQCFILLLYFACLIAFQPHPFKDTLIFPLNCWGRRSPFSDPIVLTCGLRLGLFLLFRSFPFLLLHTLLMPPIHAPFSHQSNPLALINPNCTTQPKQSCT